MLSKTKIRDNESSIQKERSSNNKPDVEDFEIPGDGGLKFKILHFNKGTSTMYKRVEIESLSNVMKEINRYIFSRYPCVSTNKVYLDYNRDKNELRLFEYDPVLNKELPIKILTMEEYNHIDGFIIHGFEYIINGIESYAQAFNEDKTRVGLLRYIPRILRSVNGNPIKHLEEFASLYYLFNHRTYFDAVTSILLSQGYTYSTLVNSVLEYFLIDDCSSKGRSMEKEIFSLEVGMGDEGLPKDGDRKSNPLTICDAAGRVGTVRSGIRLWQTIPKSRVVEDTQFKLEPLKSKQAESVRNFMIPNTLKTIGGIRLSQKILPDNFLESSEEGGLSLDSIVRNSEYIEGMRILLDTLCEPKNTGSDD